MAASKSSIREGCPTYIVHWSDLLLPNLYSRVLLSSARHDFSLSLEGQPNVQRSEVFWHDSLPVRLLPASLNTFNIYGFMDYF
jgi:hypothetical protein